MKKPDKKSILLFLKFGSVGASGVIVNQGLFYLGKNFLFGGEYRILLASFLGILVSIFTNFVLNDNWTWKDRRRAGPGAWFKRLCKYYVAAAVAGAVQLGCVWLLTQPGDNAAMPVLYSPVQTYISLDIFEMLANMAGIGAGILINFFVNNLWTFKVREDPPQRR